MKKIFIDGSAGTTGLKIYERLKERSDIELIILDDNVRKDFAARKQAINSSDISFLCLPDAAAVEAVSMVENPETVIIDTLHRPPNQPRFHLRFPRAFGKGKHCEVKANCQSRLPCKRLFGSCFPPC